MISDTFIFRTFIIFNMPYLALNCPKLHMVKDDEVNIIIPGHWPNKSFTGGLGFGPILSGAECAAGFPISRLIKKSNLPLRFIVNKGEFFLRSKFRGSTIFSSYQPSLALNIQKVINENIKLEFPVVVQASDQKSGENLGDFDFTLMISPNK
ncbi:hypothetical protein [Shewanella surugensis]|uniref:DUF4442 domain-containing protein n=1 Tax=Shewanella surugensis TaxID=212020 RepID=A0ABT0LB74_9GAMM|nr:hypothetical protein [Shewanella surugensis]MCL1124953.1 hypothetical protein [Shewanella surugensis]